MNILKLSLIALLFVVSFSACGDEPEGKGTSLRWTVVETGKSWKSSYTSNIEQYGGTVTMVCSDDFYINNLEVSIDGEKQYFHSSEMSEVFEYPGFVVITKAEKYLQFKFLPNSSLESKSVFVVVQNGDAYSRMELVQLPG